MESAKIAPSALTLPTLFSTALDYFAYTQASHSYERDHASAQLRLDLTAIKFSRFGTTAGLGRVDENDTQSTRGSAGLGSSQRETRKKTIIHIISLFQEANEQIRVSALKASSDPAGLDVENIAATSPTYSTLQETMRARLASGSFWQRFKWTVAGRHDLNDLLSNLEGLVDGLIAAIPEEQRQLCWEEARVLEDQGLAGKLLSMMGNHDPMLKAALKGIRGDNMDQVFSEVEVNEADSMRNGHVWGKNASTPRFGFSAQQTFSKIKITKLKNLVNGHTFN